MGEGTWNRLLEGLPTRIGVPKTDGSRADFVYTEDAAFLFTGPFELTAYRHGRPNQKETEQLSTRVRYFHFDRQSLAEHRGRDLNPCPHCWAKWLLRGEAAWQQIHGVAPDSFMDRALAALGLESQAPLTMSPVSSSSQHEVQQSTAPGVSQGSWIEQLAALMDWKCRGLLCDAEFSLAKQRLGLASS